MSARGAIQRIRDAQSVSRASPSNLKANSSATQSQVASELPAAFARQLEEIKEEVSRLKTLALAFERWHQDMISLMAQNRDMRQNGEDQVAIGMQLIMVSLNAAIEAARAGESARGFVVVASEVRTLSLRAQTLSKDMTKVLHRTGLHTTATFQDIQAGGKMMMAAISGLESMIERLRVASEQAC